MRNSSAFERFIVWFLGLLPNATSVWGFLFWCFVIYLTALLVSHLLAPFGSKAMDMEELSERLARKDRNIFSQRGQVKNTETSKPKRD